jgi:hypothetical protein
MLFDWLVTGQVLEVNPAMRRTALNQENPAVK